MRGLPAMHALFGASLLSAAASLPLHLMPLLLVVLGADGSLGAAEVAWIASACLLGQMAMALLLPAAGVYRLERRVAIFAVVLLLAALAGSEELVPHLRWLPWLGIGAACGTLQFLGTTTAAAFPARQIAFALRLSLTLLISGLVIGSVQLAGGFSRYTELAMRLCLICAVLTGGGLLLYRAPAVPPTVALAREAARDGPRQLAGLAVVFLLFVGQPGFWAFAIDGVRQRGAVLEDVAMAIAICKVVAALLLLGLALRGPANAGPAHLAWPGTAAAAGIAGMALASGAPQFFAAMLVWELGLNVLSARLQAAVVQDSPAASGAWLSGAALLGAAAGPVLHAAAIQGGVPTVFVAYACASAFLPFGWALLRHGGMRRARRTGLVDGSREATRPVAGLRP